MSTFNFSDQFPIDEVFTIDIELDCSISVERSYDSEFQTGAQNLDEPCNVKISVSPEVDEEVGGSVGAIIIDYIGRPLTDPEKENLETVGQITGTTTVSARLTGFDIFGNTRYINNGRYVSYEVFVVKDKEGKFTIFKKGALAEELT